MRRSAPFAVALSCALPWVLSWIAMPAAAFPAGVVRDDFTVPAGGVTTAAWAPDGSGRLFILEKTGTIRVVDTEAGQLARLGGGSALDARVFAIEPAVHTISEGGLLGLAFDPNYVVNRFLYVFVSVSASEQQVVRYADVGGVGIDRTPVIRNLPTRGANHVGGGLTTGPDGKLYFAIGDLGAGIGVDADLTTLASKIGRANLEGTPANDNPFNDGVGPNNEFIWARGLRNPFGLVMRPSTGQLWSMVAGDAYEQIFIVNRRSHAGYDDFENNQPGVGDFIAPAIVYRTNGVDTRTVTAATRLAGTIELTTAAAHGFRIGQSLAFTSSGGVARTVYVSAVPSTTTFRIADDDGSIGVPGEVSSRAIGGSVTRGAFYDSTAFGDDDRDAFYFGDFNSGNIVLASVGLAVERVDVVGTGFTQNVDVGVGDDGALYLLGFGGRLSRVALPASEQKLIVTRLHPRVPEGGRAAFVVSLAMPPDDDVVVTTTRVEGATEVDVVEGGTLVFTADDWAQPRAIVLAAAPDANTVNETATFEVAAAGLVAEDVVATTIDSNAAQLAVSSTNVLVSEGGEVTIDVSWTALPATNTTVTIRRLDGDADLTVAPTSLTFVRNTATTPQTLTIQAADDDDDIDGTATFLIASPLGAVQFSVTEVDDDEPVPPDAGFPDEPDAGFDEPDAGFDETDAGFDETDAGVSDAGFDETDAGFSDAGFDETDAGFSDAGFDDTDAGDVAPDAGPDDDDDDDDDGDVDEDDVSGGGCGCNGGSGGGLWFVAGLTLLAGRRRRR